MKKILTSFASVIAVICMFLPFAIPAPVGMAESVFKVLGITAGGMILWLFVSVDWPNFLVLLALMFVPELGANRVISTSLGNPTVFFLILCFILSGSLVKTGVARRAAIWFITCKIARKGPWYTVNMIFIAIFCLASVLSATATLMIFLPILYIIFEELGFSKEENAAFPAVMVCGVVVLSQIAQAATPISHAMTLIGMATYTGYTGDVIDFVQYCGVSLPVALAAVAAWCLLCRFAFKPDLSRVSGIDYDSLQKSLLPVKKEEIISAVTYIIVILFWALPGISKYLIPATESFFSKINQCYVPLIAIVFLHLVKTDGESVYDFRDGLKCVPWSLVFFMGAILALGSAFSNTEVGVSAWMAEAIGPLIGAMDPVIFIIVMTTMAMLLTNIMSNAVCIAVCFAVAMPIVTTVFKGQINPALISILMTSAASYAFATPPATPPAAVAASSGWLSLKRMFWYGMATTAISAVMMAIIGIPLGNLICV